MNDIKDDGVGDRIQPKDFNEENIFWSELRNSKGKKLETVFDFGSITSRDKKVVTELLEFLKDKDQLPFNFKEQLIKTHFKIEEIPERPVEKSLWHQFVHDFPPFKLGVGAIQGHRIQNVDNVKKEKIPHLSFNCDLDELDDLINHIIKKSKSMKL